MDAQRLLAMVPASVLEFRIVAHHLRTPILDPVALTPVTHLTPRENPPLVSAMMQVTSRSAKATRAWPRPETHQDTPLDASSSPVTLGEEAERAVARVRPLDTLALARGQGCA